MLFYMYKFIYVIVSRKSNCSNLFFGVLNLCVHILDVCICNEIALKCNEKLTYVKKKKKKEMLKQTLHIQVSS